MIRPARTRPASAPARGILSALERPTGAVQNGAAMPTAARTPKHRVLRPDFGKIRIEQPAAHDWRCDGCKEKGFGGGDLLEHYRLTGHSVFTPLS
jgi:hypothetical protein